MASCVENFGNKVENGISSIFHKIGTFVATKPRRTIALSILLTVVCGAGFMRWSTESRADKLWVPQATQASVEEGMYQEYYGSTSRFNHVIVQAASDGGNVLTKEVLTETLKMHKEIETSSANVTMDVDGVETSDEYTLLDLCSPGSSCTNMGAGGVCNCLVADYILRLWDFDLDKLSADTDVLATLNEKYTNKKDLEGFLGNPIFDENGDIVSAEAFSIGYFINDRSAEAGSNEAGTEADPINEGWEKDVFLKTVESVPTDFTAISVDYLAGRSFSDEFGGAIQGDLVLVQISYAVVFIFLGANMGKFIPGPESRWTMALAALVLVGLSTGASFGLSAAMGLFFGPVHSLLPFILLGIGVDDAFVIVNAFNRERKVARNTESNADIAVRSAKALARAGASITVTSLTDLVAFGISASSSLPALASFCAYASVGIFFLWLFASTFFTATLVLDERRQRDNRRECLCCLTRKKDIDEKHNSGFKEGGISTFFRKYHAPAILSKVGKAVVLILFSGLLGFGIWGALNLSVEDTQRAFIPSDSYLTQYINTADELYPSGIDLALVFKGSTEIYEKRDALANLRSRLSGKSTSAPYIAEPDAESKYSNAMEGLANFLQTNGTDSIGGATLGDDNWPTNEADFVATMKNYISFPTGPGREYYQDVYTSEDGSEIETIRVTSLYMSLTKPKGDNVIDDAERQIKAMDETRKMVESWTDLPESFTYSQKFIAIEGFKIIKKELFLNVGLALGAVAIIVFCTVASPVTSILITLNVAFCIIEILGCMHAIGIAIDSVSVINIVLAVGLSIDYSAHVGHCFMLKGGEDKNRRVLEALADIGAAVLSGAMSTFLAVVVLLFSSSYVFVTLSRQFALTVGLGVLHGLVLLPVLLSIFGPKAFEAAENPEDEDKEDSDTNVFKEEP